MIDSTNTYNIQFVTDVRLQHIITSRYECIKNNNF